MTYKRVTVALTEHEMDKLRRVAQLELRRPRDQAAYILRTFLLSNAGSLANDNTLAATPQREGVTA